MGRKEEAFVRHLIDGHTWEEAARSSELPRERARRFLESVAEFAGAVGSVFELGTRPAADGDRDAGAEQLILHTDGASLGNPGPSGAGGILTTPDGRVVEEFHEHIGHATNNVAEYMAVRIGLARALANGARRVVLRLDSELVANQLAGRYKVRDRKLIQQYLEVERLLSQLEDVRFEAIPREENKRADALAQMGARQRSGETPGACSSA
jgi:ribonuclease HI